MKDTSIIKNVATQPNCLEINNHLTINNKKYTEGFNNFFGTKAQNINQKMLKFKKRFSDYKKSNKFKLPVTTLSNQKGHWELNK